MIKILMGILEIAKEYLPLLTAIAIVFLARLLKWKPGLSKLFVPLTSSLPRARAILKESLQLDRWAILILVGYSLLVIPTLYTSAGSVGELVYSSRNDEPALTMCLESMTRAPLGNPANYWRNAASVPHEWSIIGYTFFVYCGGLQETLVFPVFAAAKLVGIDTFPSGPILLRTVSFLSGLGILIIVYNFSRRFFGKLAGLLVVGLTLTIVNFTSFAANAHPDLLMALMAIFSIVFAVAYVQDRNAEYVVLLGLAIGGAQGAKFGGPMLLPLALATLIWGSWNTTRSGRWRLGLPQFLLLGKNLVYGFLVGFFVSTPHALIWSDYWKSILDAPSQISLKIVGIDTWFAHILETQGPIVTWACIIALIKVIVDWARGRSKPQELLPAIFVVSSFFWFAIVSSTQIVYYYLYPTYIGAFILVAGLFQKFLNRAKTSGTPILRSTGIASACAIVSLTPFDRGGYIFPKFLGLAFPQSPVAANTAILAKTVSSDATIASDLSSVPLFDTIQYPNQVLIGTLKYTDLWRIRPDIFVLSTALANAPLYRSLRATQKLENSNGYGLNVGLYQDMLDRTAKPYAPGPTSVPGIEIVSTIEENEPAPTGECGIGYSSENRGIRPIAEFSCGLLKLTSPTLKPPAGIHAPATPAYVVYKMNRPGARDGAPGPISGGDFSVFVAASAFIDEGFWAWQSLQTGPDVKGASYIGFDFGVGRNESVRGIEITWFKDEPLPETLQIEVSDDAVAWRKIGEIFPAKGGGPTSDGKRVTTHLLAASEKHRLWRIVPTTGLPAGHHFTVHKIRWVH